MILSEEDKKLLEKLVNNDDIEDNIKGTEYTT